MTEKRYKSIGANLECPNGMEYMLIKRNDGFNVCQVCSKYTAKEIVDELNSLADENEQLKKSKKGQELEIVRLHHLADALSGALRELGIYDVYNKKQIDKVKKELQRNE